MAINFPHSPSINDTHTHSGKEWTWNGSSWILSTNASNYTLPIATAGALGGIKVGNRLTIDSSTGVLSADVQTSSYGNSDVDTHLNQSNPTSGHVLSWNGSDYAWVAQTTDTDTNTFTGLTGTPSTYTADKWLKVNAGGTALEYTDAPSGGGGASVSVSDTAPSTPSNGDLWFKSDEAVLKVRYEDGSSNQWVDALPMGAGGAGISASIAQVVFHTGPTGDISAVSGQGSSAAWIDVIDKDIVTTDATSKIKIEVNGEPRLNGFRTMKYEIRLIRTTGGTASTLYEGHQGLADSSDNYSTMNGVTWVESPGAGTHNYKYQFRQVVSWNSSTAYVAAESMTMTLTEINTSAGGGGGGGATVSVGDAAPGTPSAGDLWWDSDNVRLKVYYTDATPDSQWVDASPGSTLDLTAFTGNILPATHDQQDIGSATKKIRDLYLGSTSLHIGTVDVSESSGKLVLPAVEMTGHFIPDTNAAYDLGNAEYKIRHLFLSDNSLKFVDDSNVEHPLSVSSGKLHYEGKEVLANCVFTSLDNNDTLKYNGTNWVNAAAEAPSAPAFQSNWRIPL